jgi:predicted nucleotidyltransferase
VPIHEPGLEALVLAYRFKALFAASRVSKYIIMRLSQQHADLIRQHAEEIFGADVKVRLFGSRLDDTWRGGDVDLLVESADPVSKPALQAAQLESRVSRRLHGRRVDVLILAPNIPVMPIHRSARAAGVLL